MRRPVMKRAAFLVLGLIVSGAALAQDSAAALDLVLPQAPLRYGGDETYRNDPPGTYYGDTSSAPDGEWQVHGTVSAGLGWSSHGGNSNWQAAEVNMARTSVDEDGDTSHINLNLRVGQGEGPMLGRGYFAPGPYGPPVW
ncbi:hypothetical protein QLQ15_03580 [Lysobacter sp. LF1]|uniref:Uncharacterized protein n=1 Tax=Lysobacter stagni TaxID=3045172 RepID=A0ABT6XCW6_9GAMM|nr:hypothetical protein [Lysobacter sp. LF1]MDI9237985.1 hypothetical protein [Lysobacter sp. LF1]